MTLELELLTESCHQLFGIWMTVDLHSRGEWLVRLLPLAPGQAPAHVDGLVIFFR